MRNLLISIFLLSIITACESELSSIDIPDENKLVVESYISPQDTILSVRVGNTNPVIGKVSKEFKVVSNASVKMGNGSKTVNLLYEKDGYYRISPNQLALIKGQKYTLQVSTPDGRTVTSECTIPLTTIDAQKVIIDVQSINSGTKFISVKWNDLSNGQNYYAVSASFETVKNGCRSDSPFYVRDKNRDGEQFSYNFNTDIGCGNGNPNFIIVIANYDLNGYQYFSSVTDQNSVNGIPFTEPVQIFTNIKGGYGVFSGYNQFRTVVKVF
jgi:Domain of unknown function (DUF4249)